MTVLGARKTTAIPIVVEGLMGAGLYDLNGGLIMGKWDTLSLTQN